MVESAFLSRGNNRTVRTLSRFRCSLMERRRGRPNLDVRDYPSHTEVSVIATQGERRGRFELP